jgi:hypothetical protein
MFTKAELVETLYKQRQQWEALLGKIGEERMLEAGVAGHWTVKDVIAHITAYESWLVEWLRAAQKGEFPAPSVLDDADIDRRNERVYDASKAFTLEQVQAGSRRTFQDLIALIEAFPESDFTDPERTAWFMKPYWSRITTLGEAIANLSYQHYQEHIPDLTSWLEKRKPV